MTNRLIYYYCGKQIVLGHNNITKDKWRLKHYINIISGHS